MSYAEAHFVLQNQSDPIRAKKSLRFFKTGKGQYGEGDQFVGISMPDLRVIAKQFESLGYTAIQQLITSTIHEERMLAVLILIRQYKKDKQAVYQFYIDHLDYVNNWDLVDISAHLIMGQHLMDHDKSVLLELAQSPLIWHRRVAIVTTWWFIRHKQFDWTITVATVLLKDPHDLIHKAVGWMLREAGECDQHVLLSFLNKHANHMPRTMLRYAIEKLPESIRKGYLGK